MYYTFSLARDMWLPTPPIRCPVCLVSVRSRELRLDRSRVPHSTTKRAHRRLALGHGPANYLLQSAEKQNG
jgi:hypothetical protein